MDSNAEHASKRVRIGVGPSTVLESTERTLVFTRPASNSASGGDVWVFLNNYNATERPGMDSITYCPGPPAARGDMGWYNVLSSDGSMPSTGAQMDGSGCYVAPDANPRVLVLRPKSPSTSAARRMHQLGLAAVGLATMAIHSLLF